LAGKHWKGSTCATLATPVSRPISDGRYFATPLSLFVTRPVPESVSEILNRSLPFFAISLLTTPAPCTPKAIGFGFGPNLGCRQSQSQSPPLPCLFAGFSRCEKERINATDSPRLSPPSYSQFM